MRASWLVLAIASTAACGRDPAAADTHGSDAASPDGDPRQDGAAPSGDAGGDDETDAGKDAGVVGPLFAFVGSNDGKVRVFDVDTTTGKLSLKKESSAGSNPSFLAFDPPRRRVVAVDEVGGMGMVRSFAFDPVAGSLTELSAKAAGGAGSTHLSLDPSGKWILVANYSGGNMSILPLDADGMIGAATDTKSSGAMSHWAGTNPSGTHVFVPALGANVVAQYGLDTATGKLANNGSAALPPNAGPRHLAFHSNESWAYVINELAITVTTFDFDAATGKLSAKQTISALPPGQNTGGVSGAEIFVHPSGKYVYASTRGYNSVAHFSINAADGRLTLVANAPTGGNQPRSFGMDPEGTLLLAGNQSANEVVGFRIEAASGALTPLGKAVDVTNPTFVGLARMP